MLFALSETLADRRRGVKVATAANGREAVAILESEKVDLVVTDLRMPEMDGFELIAWLHGRYPHLPVIVMTAFRAETASRLDGGLELLEEEAFRHRGAEAEGHGPVAPERQGTGGEHQLGLLPPAPGAGAGRPARWASRAPAGAAGSSSAAAGSWAPKRTGPTAWPRPWRSSPGSTRPWRSRTAVRSRAPRSRAVSATCCSKGCVSTTSGSATRRVPGIGQETDAAIEALLTSDAGQGGEEAEDPPDAAETIRNALERGRALDGFLATLLVETATGNLIAAAIGTKGVDLEVAAAATAEFARQKPRVEERIGLKDAVEEILLTSTRRYYILRPVASGDLFLLLVLDRARTDLLAAQRELAAIERELTEKALT